MLGVGFWHLLRELLLDRLILGLKPIQGSTEMKRVGGVSFANFRTGSVGACDDVSLLLSQFGFGVFVEGFAISHHHAVLALKLHQLCNGRIRSQSDL